MTKTIFLLEIIEDNNGQISGNSETNFSGDRRKVYVVMKACIGIVDECVTRLLNTSGVTADIKVSEIETKDSKAGK